MEWTPEDTEYLRDFRKHLDSDNIKLKQQIKQKLLSDKYLIHVLNNKELEESDAEPADYFDVNIREYYMLPETQTDVQNFVKELIDGLDAEEQEDVLNRLQEYGSVEEGYFEVDHEWSGNMSEYRVCIEEKQI
jgi:hypothetical protein